MDKLGPGSIFENRFEIIDFLGGGGMGAVYKAKQLDANRIVALKLLHPALVETEEFRKRFLRECKLLSQLANEHIITFYHAAISAEQYPYAVFEYLDGKTLRQLLSEEKERLSLSASLDILVQITEAMQAAHDLNIIHRDLKPDNIMVGQSSGSQWVKVFDFGLSKDSITEESESQKLTLTGDIVGTAAYMSPEQCKGGRADERSDIYALGCIAYECLSGNQLFAETTPMAALQKHLNEDPSEAINGLREFCPPALTDLITDMLAKSPEKRPRTMTIVRESLMTAKSQLQQGIASSKKKSKSRIPIYVGIGAVLVGLSLAISAAFISTQKEQDTQKAKVERIQKRKREEAIERRNLVLGADLRDSAHEAIDAGNYADAIKLAGRCASLKNDTCEFVPTRLSALLILTQASYFSALADPDPPLARMGEVLKQAELKKCLSASEQSHWKLSYLLLATNVHQTKGRQLQAISCTQEFEKFHDSVPEEQHERLQFLLMLLSRGHAYRNSQQFDKAYETDQRALAYAKQMESEGADHIHSIYPSLLLDIGTVKENPKTVARLQKEYAQVFEESFSTRNAEGMMREVLQVQDNVLSHPEYVNTAAPIIIKAWNAAEMFPQVSTNLRIRSLQQLLHLKEREATNKKLNSKTLREIAESYLKILKEATKPSLASSYFGARKELALELQELLSKDGQTNLASKIKAAFENFHLDG